MLSGATAWISVKGQLMKVCTDDLTPATSDEKVGIEAVEQYLPELREELPRT